MQNVVTFLRNEEGRRPGPPIKDVSIKVKYVEAPPEAYTRQELEDLFPVSDEDEKFLWRFFLGTGFRETEVSVAEVTGKQVAFAVKSSFVLIEDLHGQRDANNFIGFPACGKIYRLQQTIRAYRKRISDG